MMNLLEFLIIYTACGTPFGMYHFINNRKTDSHWLKSLLTVFVWIPYGIWLLRENFGESLLRKPNFSKNSKSLEKIKKNLERILSEETNFAVVREFSELTERYAGLTIACKTKNQSPTEREKNFYKISGGGNKIIGAECLHRRNLKLLSFHQRLARADFLKFVSAYKNDISQADFYILLLEFVRILEDEEAEILIKNYFSPVRQSAENAAVSNLEKDLWTPDRHKPSRAKPISSGLKPLKAPTSLRLKD
jgi:CRISPR/Cas system-associated endoribonuclease Cas2